MCDCSGNCDCGTKMPNGPRGLRGTAFRFGTGDPVKISADALYDVYINTDREVWSYNGTAWVNTGIILGADGTNGTNGTNGINAYVYIGYASDNAGTGYSATPSDSLPYISVRQSVTAISPVVVGTFTGPWVKYLGDTGPGYGGTSTTSLAISVGVKSLTTQTGLAYTSGSRIRLTSASVPTLFMEGVVNTYTTSTGAISVTIDNIFSNTGTKADWGISIAGQPGAAGSIGVTGPGYYATSTTSIVMSSVTVPVSVSIATQVGLAYSAGARVRIYNTGNYIEGVVSSYSGTTLVFTADKKVGSGTFASWTVNIAGDPGAHSTALNTAVSDGVSFKAATDLSQVITTVGDGINGSTRSEPPVIGPRNKIFFQNDAYGSDYFDSGNNFDGGIYTVPVNITSANIIVEGVYITGASSMPVGIHIIKRTVAGVHSVVAATSLLDASAGILEPQLIVTGNLVAGDKYYIIPVVANSNYISAIDVTITPAAKFSITMITP